MNVKVITALLFALVLVSGTLSAEDKRSLQQWEEYIKPLLPIGGELEGNITDPDDIQLRADLYRFIYSQMALGWIAYAYNDPAYPEFTVFNNHVINQGFPNPDDVYYMTPIDDDGVYKISGYRGTVRIIDFQVAAGPLLPYGVGNFGPTLANYDIDTLDIGEDGSFEVILSPERPDGYTGNWWKLDSTASNILVRQVSYDWLHEVDGRLTIERLDTPATRPRMTAEQIDYALSHVPLWAEHWPEFSIDWYKRIHASGLINKMKVMYYGDSNGISNQRYAEGTFDINDGEALIVETDVPKGCRYWSFQLVDEFWRTIFWMDRQTNLNGYTAKIDSDGKFRAVVSLKDPGVPNWLDTGGYKKGMIYGRYKECQTNPTPVVTKVNLADVRDHLPIDTPVVTAAERDAAMRLRRKGAQLRRKW